MFNSSDYSWQTLMGVGHSDAGIEYSQLEIRGDHAEPSVKCVRVIVRTAGSYACADSTTGYTTNTWHHACGVVVSSTERHAYIDGGSMGSDTANQSFPPVNRTGIACRVSGGIDVFFDGRIAEAAIWNVALLSAEIAALAKGMRPLLIRPQNLVAYWPLVRDDDLDRWGGYHLYDYNNPGIGGHSPVIYPAPPLVPLTGMITPRLLRAIEKY
jgi:hypothetical protein